MIRLKLISLLILVIVCLQVNSQNKKVYTIARTDNSPKIDGVLDDAIWNDAQIATNFIQFRPDVGNSLSDDQKTIVKMTYNDDAIYVSAYLKDKPENIMSQITQRDDFGQNDFFALVLNPNNDAQNDTLFFVFVSGTQADAVATSSNGEDFSWNAVWDSAVKIVEDGWIVEMKIPYRTLRFTKQENPTWGVQFHRHFRNLRSQYTWNPIDPSKGIQGLYHAKLKGLKNIESPTRLSFYPFISGIVDNFDSETNTSFNAGLDIKYGITENFTLDATLIPDFSQAGFDNVQLNLGPFEQRFEEQRQFFTEGLDLFSKGDLFFSRRVGSAPTGFVELTGDEALVEDFPSKVNLLNAVKISGRTKNGLGIGFFNAITQKTEVNIENKITNEIRKEIVEPLSNYNVIVFDQQFNKNSSISLINTNVTRSGSFRDANVTAVVANIINKNNTHGLIAELKTSNLNLEEGDQSGASTRLGFGKNSGKYRWFFENTLADEKYDINDLGFQFRNNFNNFNVGTSYQIFEPTKKHNNFRINLNAEYRRLFRPGTYAGNRFSGDIFAVGKKSLTAYGGDFGIRPGKQYDYFGPRVDGRFFITEDWMGSNAWISTNYNKKIAFDGRIGIRKTFEDIRKDYERYFLRLSPRYRPNDKLLFSYALEYITEKKSRGFVDFIGDDIIYGQRDQIIIENTINASYNFSPYHGLGFNFRYYWTTVEYENELFKLEENGRLTTDDNYTKIDLDDPDVNFNTWNMNLTYSWQFAPGSFLTAQYRNRIFNFNNNGVSDWSNSSKELFDQPIGNTFSLRLVYFIDYNDMKKWFKSKSKSN